MFIFGDNLRKKAGTNRWRRSSFPPAQADIVMKTSPLAGYVVIVPSVWAALHSGKARVSRNFAAKSKKRLQLQNSL